MEVQYNPETGESAIVRDHSGYYPAFDNSSSEPESLGTLEEIQRSRLEQTARGLNRRSIERAVNQTTTDEDIDSGRANPQLAALEQQLQQVQQKIYYSKNPLEQAQLAAKAQQLAEELVTGRATEAGNDFNEETETFADQVRAELGDQINEILAFAGENLEASNVEAYNEILADDSDPQAQKLVTKTLQQFSQTPQAFATDRSQYSVLTEDQQGRIFEIVGEEVGNDIVVLNAALCAGHASPADVFRLASKDIHLLQGLSACARAGVLKLAI